MNHAKMRGYAGIHTAKNGMMKENEEVIEKETTEILRNLDKRKRQRKNRRIILMWH